MNTRRKDRIDYNILASTGERVIHKSSSSGPHSTSNRLNHSSLDQSPLDHSPVPVSDTTFQLTSSDTQLTSPDTQLTSSDTQHSSSDTQHSSSDTQHSSSDTQLTSSGTQHSSDTQHSSSDTQHSSSDTQHSSSDTQHSSSDTQRLSPDTQHQSLSAIKMSSELNDLVVSLSSYQDEIHDIIEDYAPRLIDQSPDVMKSCLEKIQGLRTQYRNKDREIKFHLQDQKSAIENYEQGYGKSYTATISEVRGYVQTLNQCIQDHKLASSQDVQTVNRLKSTFVADDLKRSMDYLKTVFTCKVDRLVNDDLKLRKKQLKSRVSEVNKLSEKMKELIDLETNDQVITASRESMMSCTNFASPMKQISTKK
eukprot:TCONS_00040482-protein